MSSKIINHFLNSVLDIMPQLGFSNIEKKDVFIKESSIKVDGVMLNLGVVGDIKGNVIYNMSEDDAKKVASKMMMGMPVLEFDNMAQSAISELSNMLTAKASIKLEKEGINTNISTPTLTHGRDFEVKTNTDKIISSEVLVDDISIKVNIAFE
ncbi:chemotaxis protein CheX [Tepidibacter aestuarii]|uniref:chemotaxis protein CheX n=1 Tax=Tepidibacter aestuarii TaxID=2925782 RepID=UPI0020BE59C7|nr:chemotaxis protein CheX [Tepidibacter aestuarii]CAH2212858.1 chemotaxis protein CheX [Tepidibacter aestuarii]